jgi:anti-anti-sigma factor
MGITSSDSQEEATDLAETWRVSKLTVDLTFVEGIPVIQASGECDLITCRKLKEVADNLIGSGINKIVFDLRDMSYIDSSGFRVLLQAKERVSEKGGDIALVSLTAPVQRVFNILHLAERVHQANTVGEAIRKLNPDQDLDTDDV